MTTWPWKEAQQSEPSHGVTRWFAISKDRTTLELLRFDFEENPKMRLELYDQDEDDDHPFDNAADYRPNGVMHVVRHLNERDRGPVLAAWNGPFFGFEASNRSIANHIGAAILRGKVHFNSGNWRWTFGVKTVNGKPQFKAVHQPDRPTMEREFDFSAVGAQCLIKDGKALKLKPEPAPGDPPLQGPVPCGPDEVGCIPVVDYISTSRTSMGWSRDSRYFYLLIVNEPDNEVESSLAWRHGEPLGPGWTLAELQTLWLSLGVWGAVNSDGGAETQLAYRLPTGHYDLLPSRLDSPNTRFEVSPDTRALPGGGSLMTFFVSEGE